MPKYVFSVDLDPDAKNDLEFVAECLARRRGDALRWILRQYAMALRSGKIAAPTLVSQQMLAVEGQEHGAATGA